MNKKWCLSRHIMNLYGSLFLWGHRVGCHQRPDRSFFYKSYQFPVCARCTGVLLGYVIAFPLFFLWRTSCFPSALICLVMLLDWLIQFLGIRESTNCRRLVTGILGGYGIMIFYFWGITLFVRGIHFLC